MPDLRLPCPSLCIPVSPESHPLLLPPTAAKWYSAKPHLSSSPVPAEAPSFTFGGSGVQVCPSKETAICVQVGWVDALISPGLIPRSVNP